MGTLIRLPSASLGARLDLLREFIDEVEEENHDVLDPNKEEEFELIANYVWPGLVALQPSWVTKLAFAWAGFAIGFAILP